MNTHNQHGLSQTSNSTNGSFDYEAMIKGLVSLCDDTEWIISLDSSGVVEQIKKPAKNELRRSSAELIGKCMSDFSQMESFENRKAVFLKVLNTGKPIRYEDRRNGNWFDSMVYPIFDKQGNVKKVLIMSRDVTRSKKAELEIKRLNESLEILVARRTAELEDKTKNLQDLNSALRVLLQKREEEKGEGKKVMLSAIKQFIIPHVLQIQHNAKDKQTLECINAIDTALQELSIKFGLSIQSKAFGLTPSEIEIALFIKSGKSSKDIANMMKISPETVESHRKNIRCKMGLKGKKENLQAYLASLEK